MWAKGIAMIRRCSLLLALALPASALAHGAELTATPVQAIALVARFDTGEPMAGAQVQAFAPDAPQTPIALGQTDAQGQFQFVPDPAPGRWTVQVRAAGHGAINYFEQGANALRVTVERPQDWGQRALMVALVAWGALGTVLFLRRNKRG